LWDGLPAHRSRAMRAWLRRQRSWLVVEPLPAYAPELNPVEALWSSLKGVELANLAGDTLNDVIAAAEHGIHRIRHTHYLAFSFLRHCGLSLWRPYGEQRPCPWNERTSSIFLMADFLDFAADESGATAKLTDSLFAKLLEEDTDDERRS
jgi:transposase